MIIRELIGFRPESAGTKLSEPVRFLTNVNKKRCTTFILSDFMDSTAATSSVLDDALKIAGSKHDLVGIRVYDPPRDGAARRGHRRAAGRRERRARSGSTLRRGPCATTMPPRGSGAAAK